MNANTTFDRKAPRERRAGAPARVPLRKRKWFRVGGWVVGASCLIACIYVALRWAE